MEIKFRKAGPEDALYIATHIMLAMQDIIFQFIGEESLENALLFLNSLVMERDNLYSYENCRVAVHEDVIIASAVVYNGADFSRLRIPVADRIKTMFGRSFELEDETDAGEYYIDSIGVSKEYQGNGIGSNMIRSLIKEFVGEKKATLGLLVEKNNTAAKKLYLKLGFERVGERMLVGKLMEHLQIQGDRAH